MKSSKVSKAEYKDAQSAQKLYSDAMNLLTESNGQQVLQRIKSYLQETPHATLQDVFEKYQSEGKTLLHVAASTKNVDVVQYALSECSNPSNLVNLKDANGFTPLINATVAESTELMRLFLSRGADSNARNNDGGTALHFAAADGSVERMSILCEAGADVNVNSQAGSPLAWAAGSGRVEAIRYLLDKGCNADSVGSSGIPALFMAAVAPSEESVVTLVEAGADVGLIVTGNLTVLHICAEHGMHAAVLAILSSETGRKTASVENSDGNQPIHLAAMGGHEDIIRALAAHSSNLPNEFFTDSSRSEVCMEAVLEDGKRRLAAWQEAHKQQQSADAPPPPPAEDPLAALPENVSEEDVKRSDELKTSGNSAFLAGDYKQAADVYSQAIELNPRNHVLWSNRSACYLSLASSTTDSAISLSHKSNALRDAEVCRRLKPDWPKGCYRLATARLALNMFEDAAVAAYEGCQLDDDNQDLKSILKKAVKLGQEEHRRNQK